MITPEIKKNLENYYSNISWVFNGLNPFIDYTEKIKDLYGKKAWNTVIQK